MERTPYPSDLTDDQGALIELWLPAAKPGGRPREVILRDMTDGLFYNLRTGGAGRMLPHDLGPWSTVHGYSRPFRLDGTWQKRPDALRERARAAAGHP